MGIYGSKARLLYVFLVSLSVFLFPTALRAQDDLLQAIKRQLAAMEEQLKKALERIDQLEKEKAANAARMGQVEQSVRATQGAPSALNPAIGMSIDATAEHRAKAGGDFNFRSAELGL